MATYEDRRNRDEAGGVKKTTRSRERLDFLELQNVGRMNAALLIVIFLMVAYGLIMLFSASISTAYANYGDPLYYVVRQLRFTVVGLFLMFFVARFTSIRIYNNFSFMMIAYAATTVLLLLVMVMGREGEYGGKRWLSLFGFQFQPSEICKLTAVYCLAAYFSFVRNMQKRGQFKKENARQQWLLDGRLYVLIPGLAIFFWLLLIVVQPHVSGAVIVATISLMVFFAAKIPVKVWLSGILQSLPILLALLMLTFLAFPLIRKGESFSDFIKEKFVHVNQRMDTYQNPDEANSDQIHQVMQSRLALGSGGLSGKGLGMSRQKSGFLPMVYNDYILPAIGEELGFLGTASVVIIFLVFMLIAMQIALRGNTLFAALMAWGYGFMISIQAFLNIAVAAEVIPSTGISLPFFSYGGSANMIFLVAAGFILCVSRSGQRMDSELRALLQPERPERGQPVKRGKKARSSAVKRRSRSASAAGESRTRRRPPGGPR